MAFAVCEKRAPIPTPVQTGSGSKGLTSLHQRRYLRLTPPLRPENHRMPTRGCPVRSQKGFKTSTKKGAEAPCIAEQLTESVKLIAHAQFQLVPFAFKSGVMEPNRIRRSPQVIAATGTISPASIGPVHKRGEQRILHGVSHLASHAQIDQSTGLRPHLHLARPPGPTSALKSRSQNQMQFKNSI